MYSPEQIQQRLTKQFFEDENGNIVIGTTTYTVNDLLTDETIRNKAKQYIMDNFHYNIDEDGLNNSAISTPPCPLISDILYWALSGLSKWAI